MSDLSDILSEAHPGLNRKLQKAADLLARGQARQAADLCLHFLEARPDDVAALMLCSKAAQRLLDYELMLDMAQRACAARPKNVDARLRWADCLMFAGRANEALQVARQIETTATDLRGALRRVGRFYGHNGQHEDAWRCHIRALELQPGDPAAAFDAAFACGATGRFEQAEKLYDQVIYLKPDDFEAWYERSRLRRNRPEANHVDPLRFVLAHMDEGGRGAIPVCYALGQELEDLGRYQEALHYLELAATHQRRLLDYDVARDESLMAQVASAFGEDRISDGASGHRGPRPIFVVGLPCSGAGLVQHILDTHPGCRSLGALNTLPALLLRSVGRQWDQVDLGRQAAGIDFATLGRRYAEGVAGLAGPDGATVDHSPLHFCLLGLIHKALPDARIVHVRRHPVDNCHALYRSLFTRGIHHYSYDPVELGRYLQAYEALMDHWRQVLPGRMVEVDYEALLAVPEIQVRRLLDHLELDWHRDCAAFGQPEEPGEANGIRLARRYAERQPAGRWRAHRTFWSEVAGSLAEAGVRGMQSGRGPA